MLRFRLQIFTPSVFCAFTTFFTKATPSVFFVFYFKIKYLLMLRKAAELQNICSRNDEK